MISNLLIATDGSEGAAAAEKATVQLASRLRARIHGLSVVEDRFTKGFRDSGLGVAAPNLENLSTFLKARADAALRRLSERARSAGVEVQGHPADGIADDRIVERGESADLIALGREGMHAAFHTAVVGSTVNGVLRKTTKPVLMLPTGAEIGGPILVAFDGSPGSRIAATLAVDLVTRTAEPIHVFVDSKDKGRAAQRFDQVRAIVGSIPVPVREISSTLGRPDVKIIDAARELRAGLIVMGAYGRNRISEYFLGSNAAAVARTTPIALLLAR
jgi:nucleotide-binding universal stress UspA family protein